MNKEIFRLAIPNIISNVTVPLLSTVDTALMGRLSALHIAAIGIGGLIFNFVYWNFGFLRMGTTGLTAQAFGSSNQQEQKTILVQSLAVGLILAFCILLLSYPIMHYAGYLLNIQGEQLDIVQQYFFIRIWDAPAALALYAVLGWMFGMQNAYYPLIITVIINVVNIVLSYILVMHFQLEIVGVAWGTVIAQYFGLVCAIVLIQTKFKELSFGFKSIRFSVFNNLKRFLVVNSDIFIRTVCLTLVFGIFYSKSSQLGSVTLAANVILLLYVNWMSYAIDGFAYAAESLVGKYTGKKDPEGLQKTIKYIFFWSAMVAIFVAIVYATFGEQIAGIFTTEEAVLEELYVYKYWVILFPIFAFVCYIWDGIYIGLTAVKSMRNSMLISFVLFLILLKWSGQFYGNHGIWLALLCFMVFRGIFQTFLYWRKGIQLN